MTIYLPPRCEQAITFCARLIIEQNFWDSSGFFPRTQFIIYYYIIWGKIFVIGGLLIAKHLIPRNHDEHLGPLEESYIFNLGQRCFLMREILMFFFQIFNKGVCGPRHRGRPQQRRQRTHREVLLGKGIRRSQQYLN